MTHPLIENYADYFVVLARTDDKPTKDERFVTRAFASSGFNDEESGDEGIQFRHEETGLTLACDGDTVVIHNPANDDIDAIRSIIGDLFLSLQRMGWESAKVYCANDAEDVFHEMASRIPASYEGFDLSLHVERPTPEDVADLRATIEAHQAGGEPSFRIAELNPAADELGHGQDPWGKLADEHVDAVDNLSNSESVERNVLDEVRDLAGAPSEVASAGTAHVGARPVAQKNPDFHEHPSMVSVYERQLIAREKEIEGLQEIIKQILLGQSMNQFAAAVLPHDAILIAHLYAPVTSKLDLLGFERVYNVFTNEEYGVTVDGAFLVFTKDVAGPDWIEKLLRRLGGRIARLWQAEASMVGTLLEQHVETARSGSERYNEHKTSDASTVQLGLKVESGPAEVGRSESTASQADMQQHSAIHQSDFDIASTLHLEQRERIDDANGNRDDALTPEQRKAMDALNSTFSTVLMEVFKSSNATARVAIRVADLEASEATRSNESTQ